MQLITTVIALFVAVGVNALPGTPVQERQATPTVYAKFYSGNGCDGTWVDDFVFAENVSGCQALPNFSPFSSTFFSGNHLTHSLRVYNQPGCPETGNINYITIGAGAPDQCFFLPNLKSYRFLP